MDDDWGYLPVWETSIWILKLKSPLPWVWGSRTFTHTHMTHVQLNFPHARAGVWFVHHVPVFLCFEINPHCPCFSVFRNKSPSIHLSILPSKNSQHGTCELKLGLDDIPILGVLWRELSNTKLTRPMLVYCIPLCYIWSMWGLWAYISMIKIVAWIERKPQFEVPKLATACVTHTSPRSFYAVQRLPSGTETFDVQNIKVTAENGALDAHNGLRSESCWVQVQWKPWPIYSLFMIYHDIPIQNGDFP